MNLDISIQTIAWVYALYNIGFTIITGWMIWRYYETKWNMEFYQRECAHYIGEYDAMVLKYNELVAEYYTLEQELRDLECDDDEDDSTSSYIDGEVICLPPQPSLGAAREDI